MKTAATYPATAQARVSAASDYRLEQARAGRLVDKSSTVAAVVGGVTSVWERGLALDSVKLDSVSDGQPDPVAQGLGIQAHATADSNAEPGSTALGMSGAIGISGARFVSGYCTTTYSPKVRNKLTSCFQKYKIRASTRSRDFYYYNRFATAEGKQIDFDFDYSPTKIDVRSRPWRGSAGVGTAALVDYWPKAGAKSCDDHSITVSYGAFSGQMPIQDCEEVNPSPDATRRAMTVIYDQGLIFSGRVHGTDMSFVYSTFKKKNPAYADYSYAKYCRGTYADCDGVLRKESGW